MHNLNRRTRLVYGVLLAVWAMILVWQHGEHDRVRQAVKATLINRAKDISTTVGLVMRSQRRFGVISRDRMESALSSLIEPGDLNAIALLNAEGEVVASAGSAIDFAKKGLVPTGEHWGEGIVTLINLVDLETNVTTEAEGPRPTIVLPRPDGAAAAGTNRPLVGRPADSPALPTGTNVPATPSPTTSAVETSQSPPANLPVSTAASAPTNSAESPDRPPRRRGWPRPRGEGEGRPPFGRPYWMSEEEYRAAIQKQGVHGFAIVLSTQPVLAASRQDLWLRCIISALTSVSVLGLGLAWRNLLRSSELEVRLVRAAELNTRLKEMNFAAAGLAHETKNPLNIIRGLAQMISRQPDAPAETRQKSHSIVEEADRVTAQLNEFINFSRPREVRRSTVALNSVAGDVVRALGHDVEEKGIRVEVQPNLPVIEADEPQLRQAVFNLLLNAIQAAEPGGEIRVVGSPSSATEAVLEIRDNGPGVPPENRTEVFKPYFTTSAKGTGLGLAVVQQIILAHGWEIECLPNSPRGAIFRISHLRLAANA